MKDKAPKFAQSKRRELWVTGISPGPAQYNINPGSKYLKSKAKNGSFSKSKKRFWMDQQPKAMAPGPIYNPSKHYTSKLV